ncbi:hypothetical protein FSP39_010827 [Pinctada imbricata]|uniref:Mitochondria-eating protein C-terminal domain-containing protein n=1 Tax=Pinctada imbricata TaxID=66713 RepID=A0AA88Y8H4_PINIB|nr:hypothetical protein FSP39_010827 [Pinctada imbricata]
MEKGGRNFPSCMSSLVHYHEKRSSSDEAWSILQTLGDDISMEYHDVAGSVSTKKPEFLSFIKACLESFWVAVIHDPPLYFDFESKPRSKFDASENRVFTKSGEYIWYVVWPSIRLSENGPLLAKGVVQCTSDEKKLKFVKDENVQRHH